MASQFSDDAQFNGNVTFTNKVSFPAQTIGDAQINASAPITAPKMEHRHQPHFIQSGVAAAAADRRVVYRAKSPGTVTGLWVGLTVANVGAATVTVDFLKNGTTVLATPVVLTSATVPYTGAVAAAVATAAYTTGDVFEVSVAVAAGGGTLGMGVFAQPTLTEAA